MAPGTCGTDGTTVGIWGGDGTAAGEPTAAGELAAAGDADADATGEGEVRPMFCIAWPAAFCPACCAAPWAAEPAPCITLLPTPCARAQRGIHERMIAPVNPMRAFMKSSSSFGEPLAQICRSLSVGMRRPAETRVIFPFPMPAF
jgi:hypothetical protein